MQCCIAIIPANSDLCTPTRHALTTPRAASNASRMIIRKTISGWLAWGGHALNAIAALALIALLAACSGGNGINVKHVGLSCVDDSVHCIQKRQSALKSMLADTSNSWVNQPVTAEAYASGVRLFAYKKKKKQLSCADLRRGQNEAKNARAVLRSSAGSNLSPAQIARGAMLGTEVARELKREIRRRCGKA